MTRPISSLSSLEIRITSYNVCYTKLLRENNNGNVGMLGNSYPGYYAAAATINAHPALKAVTPQCPVSDWFFDDFHHNGAFFSYNFV